MWDKILSKQWSLELQHRMMTLSPDPDFDELYEFSLLHKAVLGLIDHSIEESILAEPGQVGKQDKGGRTALSWAVCRRDSEMTRKLLSHEPRYSKAGDRRGIPPLGYAVAASLECTKLLLQANADAQCGDQFRRTLLHHAVQSPILGSEAFQMVELLIEGGVDVNAVNCLGETALLLTQEPKIASYLLEHNANLSISDFGGNNALSRAVQRNQYGLIDLLLRNRLDNTAKLDSYGTFMHLAAGYGDVKSLQLLSRGQLKRRDINVKNDAGLTPSQVAMQRKDVDGEWWSVFMSFLRSIDEDQPTTEGSQILPSSLDTLDIRDGSEAMESDGEFEEAFEFQL